MLAVVALCWLLVGAGVSDKEIESVMALLRRVGGDNWFLGYGWPGWFLGLFGRCLGEGSWGWRIRTDGRGVDKLGYPGVEV